jgi:hypothetical protein
MYVHMSGDPSVSSTGSAGGEAARRSGGVARKFQPPSSHPTR